jgi:biotin transporter BioY
VLIVAGVTGALDAADFPHPVGGPLVVATGVVLLPLALVIWRLPPSSETLRALALGNIATALLGAIWLALASGFSAQGAAVTGAAVVILACLALAQVGASVRRRDRAPSPG